MEKKSPANNIFYELWQHYEKQSGIESLQQVRFPPEISSRESTKCHHQIRQTYGHHCGIEL